MTDVAKQDVHPPVGLAEYRSFVDHSICLLLNCRQIIWTWPRANPAGGWGHFLREQCKGSWSRRWNDISQKRPPADASKDVNAAWNIKVDGDLYTLPSVGNL